MCCSKGDRCPAKLDPSSQAVTDGKPLSAPDSYSKYAQTVEKHTKTAIRQLTREISHSCRAGYHKNVDPVVTQMEQAAAVGDHTGVAHLTGLLSTANRGTSFA